MSLSPGHSWKHKTSTVPSDRAKSTDQRKIEMKDNQNHLRRPVDRKRTIQSMGHQARKEHGQEKQPGELPHSCFLLCPLSQCFVLQLTLPLSALVGFLLFVDLNKFFVIHLYAFGYLLCKMPFSIPTFLSRIYLPLIIILFLS